MLGASVDICSAALPHFADRRVTMVAHADEAGRKAGLRWAKQIQGAGRLARISNLKRATSATSWQRAQLIMTSGSFNMKSEYGDWIEQDAREGAKETSLAANGIGQGLVRRSPAYAA